MWKGQHKKTIDNEVAFNKHYKDCGDNDNHRLD